MDIERELGITEDADAFLIKKIPELQLEATDNLCDLEDNQIFWFSAEDEVECMQKIYDVLSSCISKSVANAIYSKNLF